MTKYLFGIEDVKCFLSRNICQDPLEKFFGVKRQMGCTHSNHKMYNFKKNTQATTATDIYEIHQPSSTTKYAGSPTLKKFL